MILQLPPALPAPLQETVNHLVGHCARWLRGHVELLTVRLKKNYIIKHNILKCIYICIIYIYTDPPCKRLSRRALGSC